MKITKLKFILGASIIFSSSAAMAQEMNFFVTSAGSGHGGNLGGLAGADARCQALAAVAGAGDKTWHAYLSTQGMNAVNARDRIGSGPWYNVNGTMIATNLDELHQEETNNLSVENALDEHGGAVGPVGLNDQGVPLPVSIQAGLGVEHDVLTGSQADGTAFPPGNDSTCNNWTSSDEGSGAMVGHTDRRSLEPGLSPWAAAHPSAGCSQQALVNTGGSGRYYCFAID
ncbi:MAG: hypothetical protein ACJ0BT_01920 [Pseudohongiellaceae bacterium]